MSWKNGDSATAFHCRFNGTQLENVINLEQTPFSFKTYSVLGNLYNVGSLMYVQMRVMDQDEKEEETCTHNMEKKVMEHFDGNNAE